MNDQLLKAHSHPTEPRSEKARSTIPRIARAWRSPWCLAVLALGPLGCGSAGSETLSTGGSGGAAGCPAGYEECGAACVNLSTDAKNCGACGTACPAPQVCSSGTCAGSCGAGETPCGQSCVNLSADVSHCGACGTACASGQSCVAGRCTGDSVGGSGGSGGTTTSGSGGAPGGGTPSGGASSGGASSGGAPGGGGPSGGASSGGAASGGSATGGAIEATGGVAVTCSTPLADRVKVTPIAVTPEVSLEGGQSWGSTNLPVLFSTAPNGTAKAAWTDGSSVHVTPLDAADQRAGDDALVTGSEVRGLVAHDDGSAVLVVDGDSMTFVRLDQAGNTQASLSIVGGNSHTNDGDRWIDSWPHQGRLAWSGSEYAAYFGQTGNHGSAGDHQGDHYSFISPDGTLQDGGWDWGCSHSLDERLAHNGSTFAPICTSDTYPGAGIWFNNRVEVSSEPSITNTGGGTKLGGLVPAPDGFWLTFNSPEGRSSYDVVFLHIDNEGSPSGRVYLTDTSEDETFSHLAAYGGGLLAGWGGETDLTLAVLDTSGTLTEGPVAISAQAGGLDDFATYPNGDVGWAFAWGDLSNLQIVRVAHCE